MTESAIFIGIMSGTSADGIDIAIVEDSSSDPNGSLELLHFSEQAMPAELRGPILKLATSEAGPSDAIDTMGELDRTLAEAYADAVLTAMHDARLKKDDIAAIGCHGQTIRHRPHADHPFTTQIGCAATLSERTGITTVSNFRSRDIAADGEGAPLVPFSHRQLFAHTQNNIAVVNIGGIANVTWLGIDDSTTGFDTGPGNMIMDGLILAISNGEKTFDYNGELAASGEVCQPLLEQLLSHPYLQRRPPKSTGREEFGEEVVHLIINWPGISAADRLATACQFTADSICNSTRFMPEQPDHWYICGGGTRNHHLMQLLTRQLAPAPVNTTRSAGVEPQAVEAVCFAILARQTLMGKPNTLSAVTGADHDVCGGQITPGDNWPRLLNQISSWTR